MTLSELNKEFDLAIEKIEELQKNKLDKSVFSEWSNLRDIQLDSMKNSYDNNLDNLKKQIDKYLNKINKVIDLQGNKKDYEEPMLAKKPINCASCNREIIHTKLEKSA